MAIESPDHSLPWELVSDVNKTQNMQTREINLVSTLELSFNLASIRIWLLSFRHCYYDYLFTHRILLIFPILCFLTAKIPAKFYQVSIFLSETLDFMISVSNLSNESSCGQKTDGDRCKHSYWNSICKRWRCSWVEPDAQIDEQGSQCPSTNTSMARCI